MKSALTAAALTVAILVLIGASNSQTPEYSHRLAEPAYIVIWDESEIICEEREGTQAHVVECMTLERYRSR